MDGLAALGLASVINALDEFKGGAYRKADNTQQFSLFYHHALHASDLIFVLTHT
jgi:hypothetical protein